MRMRVTRPSRARTGDTAAEGPSRSVRFGSVRRRFGSTSVRFPTDLDVGSDRVNCDRRSNRLEDDRLASRRRTDADERGRERERGERRER